MTYALDIATRKSLEKYKKHIATMNGVEDFSSPFSIQPSVEQVMVDRYSQETEFLKLINIIAVKGASGEKLGLGNNRSAASTTDTRIQPRRPTDIFEMEGIDEYLCTDTNFDIALKWKIIDNWGHLPNFQKLCSDLAIATVAQDMQRIGFNGTHRVKTSNRDLYPMLNDVNVGWLEKIRAYNPERYIDGIKVGTSHEFKNMDALAEMVVSELIGEQHRTTKDLVAITSDGLILDKYSNIINQNHAPTEQVAANALYSKKNLGTLPVNTPSFFVPNGLFITSYDNLSIYKEKGSFRRFFKEEPEWEQTSDYNSVKECYVVEDYSKAAFIENIELEV